jgi:coenzyme F420 hydrogenase subunit beta
MPRRKIATITDVAENHLCTGCGVCAGLQPTEFEMVDDFDYGRRPVVIPGREHVPTDEAFAACPGRGLERDPRPAAADPDLFEAWGPVLEVWEGYASDPDVRFLGSSGGISTALAGYALSEAGFGGALHIRQDPKRAYLNETVVSRSVDALREATGSRYAPASPGEMLHEVESSDDPMVMIGKPCDIAGARNAARLRPALAEKLGLTIAIYCAGTPSARATWELARWMGFDKPTEVDGVRYRGRGWPGNARITGRIAGADASRETTYAESWGEHLQQHRQWRCYVCADHVGEFADIAVGDPWYRTPEPDDPGRSLVVVRTERGRRMLADAIEAGWLTLERVPGHLIADSQPGLLETRASVWGRNVALRAVGVPAPQYRNMALGRSWRRDLDLTAKVRSFSGTFRRIWRKRLFRSVTVTPFDADAFEAEFVDGRGGADGG